MPKERVPAKTIAEHLLWLRSDSVTTPLHIVKLVYLCHGWMLGLKGRPLVDEPVVTGRYGPVIQSLYDRYSIFGDGPIMGAEVIDHTPDLDPLQLSVVNFVHAVYQEFPDTELSEMTHEPGNAVVQNLQESRARCRDPQGANPGPLSADGDRNSASRPCLSRN